MRNLKKYEMDYQKQPFEKYQVVFRKKIVVSSLVQYKAQHVLEIGCGLSPIFEAYKNFKSLTILEPADLFFHTAKKKIKRSGLQSKVSIYQTTLEKSDAFLKERSFDFIILSSLLHELKNPGRVLDRIHALSGKNTILHVNVPNANSFHRLLALEMGLIRSLTERSKMQTQFQQDRIYTEESLRALLKKHGFQPLRQGSYAVKPFTYSQMQQMIDKKIIGLDVLEGLFKMSKHLPGMGSEIFVDARKK